MLIFSVLGLFLQIAFIKLFIPENKREAKDSVENDGAKESLVGDEPSKVEKAQQDAHSRISFGIYASSIFVIIAATLIYFNESLWYMDSFATYFFAFTIIATTFPLFKNSLLELTETTPPEINLHELKLAIRAIDNSSIITRVYDVNLWKLGGKNCL
jgi:Co/Zn/Cd efflux system component